MFYLVSTLSQSRGEVNSGGTIPSYGGAAEDKLLLPLPLGKVRQTHRYTDKEIDADLDRMFQAPHKCRPLWGHVPHVANWSALSLL